MNKTEKIAIEKYLSGEKPSCSTFIDEITITVGYGNLDSLGIFEYELPLWFRKKHNIYYGCKTWNEWMNINLRKQKLKRILKNNG